MNSSISGPAFVLGKPVEWNDAAIYINGARVADVKGWEFGADTEKEHIFTEGDEPTAIQSGNRKPSGSIKMLSRSVDVLNVAAVAAGGRDINDLEWDFVAVFQAQGIRGLQTYTVSGCQTSSYKYAMDQNAKEMVMTLPFLAMDGPIIT